MVLVRVTNKKGFYHLLFINIFNEPDRRNNDDEYGDNMMTPTNQTEATMSVAEKRERCGS